MSKICRQQKSKEKKKIRCDKNLLVRAYFFFLCVMRCQRYACKCEWYMCDDLNISSDVSINIRLNT